MGKEKTKEEEKKVKECAFGAVGVLSIITAICYLYSFRLA